MAAREGNVLKVPGTGSVAGINPDEIIASYTDRLVYKGGTIKGGQGVLETGQVMAFETASEKWVKYAGSTDEVQTVTITGTPSGGTFTLTYSGQTTGPIAYNAPAATVQAALVALSNIDTGDVGVSGSAGGPYTVTFTGALADENLAQMTATGSFTGGSSPAVNVTTATQGGSSTGSGGAQTARAILRKGVDTTSGDFLGNLIFGGVVFLNKIVGLDSRARTQLGGRIDPIMGWFDF